MSDCECCSAESAGSGQMICQTSATTAPIMAETCPVTGARGKKISLTTIKAMLGVSLEAVRDVDYYFCPQADCSVVYFSADHTQTFSTAEVRERVYQKEPDADDVFVCYCFRHTPGSIRAELAETGKGMVVDLITAGIQAGQCGCDVRNPQGTCCLGNVTTVVRRFQE